MEVSGPKSGGYSHSLPFNRTGQGGEVSSQALTSGPGRASQGGGRGSE